MQYSWIKRRAALLSIRNLQKLGIRYRVKGKEGTLKPRVLIFTHNK
jgi:hypothetical protein